MFVVMFLSSNCLCFLQIHLKVLENDFGVQKKDKLKLSFFVIGILAFGYKILHL